MLFTYILSGDDIIGKFISFIGKIIFKVIVKCGNKNENKIDIKMAK